MQTAADFDQFYAEPDPWRISRAAFRDRALRRSICNFVADKSVLELCCGEGHLTQAIFGNARHITGVDLSAIAIQRAKSLGLANAGFMAADFLSLSFDGFDVIAAIECLYYLTPENQSMFFEKVAQKHRGKILIVSGPIVGKSEHREYFTHDDLLQTFARHGFSVVDFSNLTVYRRGALATMAALLVRLPLGERLLNWLPTSLINQRCYIVRSSF
jgi:cyclopropane fatty-acyl-phospholipid synthase-like methyltransferase